MIWKAALPGLFALLMLSACDGGREPKWEATKSAKEIAQGECGEQVDQKMQLRGYPRRPSPETPQFGYRKEIFAKCMRDKGYEEQ